MFMFILVLFCSTISQILKFNFIKGSKNNSIFDIMHSTFSVSLIWWNQIMIYSTMIQNNLFLIFFVRLEDTIFYKKPKVAFHLEIFHVFLTVIFFVWFNVMLSDVHFLQQSLFNLRKQYLWSIILRYSEIEILLCLQQ